MTALLGENEAPTEESPSLVSFKPLVQQLVVAMQAIGLNPDEDDNVDVFLKMLKTLSTSKAQMLRAALKNRSGAKASRALRVAKKAV
jgi:hypothetical protein